jgi:hypothetical protein
MPSRGSDDGSSSPSCGSQCCAWRPFRGHHRPATARAVRVYARAGRSRCSSRRVDKYSDRQMGLGAWEQSLWRSQRMAVRRQKRRGRHTQKVESASGVCAMPRAGIPRRLRWQLRTLIRIVNGDSRSGKGMSARPTIRSGEWSPHNKCDVFLSEEWVTHQSTTRPHTASPGNGQIRGHQSRC